MKKIISAILVCVLMVGCLFTLASCGKVSESYAEKVNNAAKADEHYTYDKLMKDLGKNAIDLTFAVADNHSGLVVAVKGIDTLDELEEKLENGETIKGIVFSVVANKVTRANYKELEADDLG